MDYATRLAAELASLRLARADVLTHPTSLPIHDCDAYLAEEVQALVARLVEELTAYGISIRTIQESVASQRETIERIEQQVERLLDAAS